MRLYTYININMIYVYRIGNCNHPFPPYQSINPLRWATSEALQPLHKGLKAAEMAREEMQKNMVRVSAWLRDFETSTSIQLPGSKVCAVSFCFCKMMRPSNHEYATTNCWILGWQHWNLRMEAVLTWAVGTTETQSIRIFRGHQGAATFRGATARERGTLQAFGFFE